MKTFSEYIKTKIKKPDILSWPSSHAENRKPSKKISILSWKSSHSENRKPEKLSEEVTVHVNTDAWSNEPIQKTKVGPGGGAYHPDIHDDPDVKPKRLKHSKSVVAYTGSPSKGSAGSSNNVNNYLRNKLGDKKVGVMHQTPDDVHKAVKDLSSNFTPENTNRKELQTYSGVPQHIGEKLEASKKGDIHHLAGFTSTSTSKRIAHSFSVPELDSKKPKEHHIIKFHVKPGAGLSVVRASEHSENEILLHHGARVEYSHTEVHKGKAYKTPGSASIEVHVHHVTVHPDHLDLDKHYGSYDEPK